MGTQERRQLDEGPHRRLERKVAERERAETIESETAWLNDTEDGRRCSMYLYWNSPGTEGDPSHVLDEQYGIPAVRKLLTAFAATPDVALI